MVLDCKENLCPPRQRLVAWLSRLYSHRLTTTTGGNLSLLDDDGSLYITPSGGDKAIVPSENVAVCRRAFDCGPSQQDDRKISATATTAAAKKTLSFEGPLPPSMEHPLHTAAYQVRGSKECRAVLHAHSLTLVAFSMAEVKRDDDASFDDDHVDPRIPDTRCLLSTWQICGKVAFVPYAIPGSQALADGCRKAFEEQGADCVILQNHGVVVIGKTMHQAFDRFVSLEYLARSLVYAVSLRIRPLPLSPRILQQYDCSVPNRDSDNFQRRQQSGDEQAVKKRKTITTTGTNGVEALDEKSNEIHHDENNNNSLFNHDTFQQDVPTYQATQHNNGQQQRIITSHEKEERVALCEFVHRAYRQDLVTSSSGSFSTRLVIPENYQEDNVQFQQKDTTKESFQFLITPTGVDRLTLEPSDVCLVATVDSLEHQNATTGSLLRHRLCHFPVHHVNSPEYVEPSRAARVHATIYAKHPSINCIMVVQPPYATSYCITGHPFDSAGIPESHLVLHHVATLPMEAVMENHGQELAEALDPASGRTTVLVKGYGLITVGTTLLKTFVQVEVCESMCGVSLTGLSRGPMTVLSKEQVEDLNKAFQKGH